MNARIPAWLLGATLVVSLVACTAGSTPGASGGPSPAPSAAIGITDAWVRAAATTDTPTAAYLTIVNGGTQDDALLGATSPGAASVELHETAMDSSGMAGMHPVDRLAVAAGATVKLEPGGYHLMLTGLTKPLAAGDTLVLDLTFEHAGKIVVQAEVRQG